MFYTFLLIDLGHDIAAKEIRKFDNDGAAVEHARKSLWRWTYEIWSSNRLVAQGAPDLTEGHAVDMRAAA